MSIFTIHVHTHGATAEELKAIHASLICIKELIMITAAEMTAGFDRLDVATSAVADLIRNLVAGQKAGNMTEAEEDAAHARLLMAADALEAMGKAPGDPVPIPVPV